MTDDAEYDDAPPALSPLRARQAIERLAAGRGEPALRLAMHAALPQVLQAELLQTLCLNFLPRALDDAALLADVLFAPFCHPLGHGRFEFDAETRLQLLRQLDPFHPGETPPRSTQVADFLLAWFDRERGRARADADPLHRGWIEQERWSALAFADPAAAAEHLAAALQQAVAPGRPPALAAARLHIGGLAASLATPLVAQRRLLAYAAGVEALDRGDVERAQRLLEDAGEQALAVGAVVLPPASELLPARSIGGESVAPAASDPAPASGVLITQNPRFDRDLAFELRAALQPRLGDEAIDVLAGDSAAHVVTSYRVLVLLLEHGSLDSDRQGDDGDHLRRTVSLALANGLSVVPVLVEATRMPDAASLPIPLLDLLYVEALRVNQPPAQAELDRLADAVQRGMRPQEAQRVLLQIGHPHPREFVVLRSELQRHGIAIERADDSIASTQRSAAAGNAPAAMVAALRATRFLVLDLALPLATVRAWCAAVLEAQRPVVPILSSAASPTQREGAANALRACSRFAAPTVAYRLAGELADRFAERFIAASDRVRQSLGTPPAEPPPPRSGASVMLSSTTLDLEEERAAVMEALQRIGCDVVHQASWLESEDALRHHAELDRCDALIVIVAFHHGYVPAPKRDARSVVELDVEAARARDLPIFVFMRHDDARDSARHDDALTGSGAKGQGVQAFRERLQRHGLVQFYRSTPQLVEAVTRAMLLPLPKPKTQPASPADRVLLFVGHTIDPADRSWPRFPAWMAPRVAAAIERAIAEELANGPVTWALASASHGGDLLFLRACAALDVPARIFLPLPDRKFIEQYVKPAGDDWVALYQEAARRSPVIVLPDEPEDGASGSSGASPERWRLNADAMLEAALAHGAAHVTLIALWDGQPRESPGGPTYLLARADTLGIRAVVIDSRRLLHDGPATA